MGIQEELRLQNPILNQAHETVLGIVFTGSLLTKLGGRLLRRFDLTDAQFNILMLLRHQAEGGRITQTRLGEMLLVNRSNVTGLVDRLERDGLVRRIADPEDRRINLVELTVAGLERLEQAKQDYYDYIETVMAGLSEEQRKALAGLLENVRRQVRNNGYGQ